MTDRQIEFLKSTLLNAGNLHWVDNECNYRKITSFGKRDDSGDGTEGDGNFEPVAYFDNGEFIALWNCEPKEFVLLTVLPVFHDELSLE